MITVIQTPAADCRSVKANLPDEPSPEHTPHPQARLHLRLLQTSDVHGALRAYDYLSDGPVATLGLCRTASLIHQARAGAANSLLFDTGDMLQGSPVCDLVAERGLAPDQTHPLIAAMNALGYDAFAPGNHDFNHGADLLFRALKDADFAVTCANFLHRATRQPVFAPYDILCRRVTDTTGVTHDLRIAVVGCLPPQTTDWDHDLASDFVTTGMVTATRAAARAARDKGCDLVVLLAHSGIDPAASGPRAENAVIDLAGLPDVDVVLCGHTHLLFPDPAQPGPEHPAIDVGRGTIHGKPVMMPGFGGNPLGQLDLTLSNNPTDPAGRWQITASRATLLPLARRDDRGTLVDVAPEDPGFCGRFDAVHTQTLDYMREPLGETRQPLHSFFSLVSNDAATQIVAAAQATYLRETVRGTELEALPILSIAAPFKTGRRGGPQHYTCIPRGALSRRAVTDLYAYPNRFCAVSLTGALLREWLEHSASLFSHLPPGAAPDAPLLDDSFPGYKFDIVLGLRYTIDLSQPARYTHRMTLADPSARRIRALTYRGAPVGDDQRFLLATNSYRTFGVGLPDAGGIAAPPRVVLDGSVANRDILCSFICDHAPLDFTPDPVWSFSPLGGMTAVFQTSPLARRYLDTPGLPPLADLGDTPDGFANFRITL